MLVELGLIFFLFGIALVFLGVILSSIRRVREVDTKVGGGGVVLIGPIPIVFGTSSKWVVVALVLVILLMLLSLIFYRW